MIIRDQVCYVAMFTVDPRGGDLIHFIEGRAVRFGRALFRGNRRAREILQMGGVAVPFQFLDRRIKIIGRIEIGPRPGDTGKKQKSSCTLRHPAQESPFRFLLLCQISFSKWADSYVGLP